MPISKDQFGIEITRLLKERKLTQKGLAEHLGLTSAAVSYLLHGKLRPSPSHFDGMMEYLKADAQLIAAMRDYWRATRGDQEERSCANENLFALRCRKGLSIQAVSSSTGISVERLRVLENRPDAAPSEEEIARLKEFFGADGFAFPHTPSPLPRGMVAEEFSPCVQSGQKRLPLLTVETFARLPVGVKIGEFTRKMVLEHKLRPVDINLAERAQALVICDAEELHYGVPGTIELIIGDQDDAYRDILYIGRGARGAVSLFHRRRHTLSYYGFASPAPRISSTVSLPVLEFKFTASPRFVG